MGENKKEISGLYVNPNNAARDGGVYGNVISQIVKDGVCPFCEENLQKYHKKPIHKTTANWVLTDNMYPYKGAKSHLLFIHKKHVTRIDEVSAEAWAELQELIVYALKTFNIPGSAFLLRNGDTRYTGASVGHLHAQLVSSDPTAPGYEPILARVG